MENGRFQRLNKESTSNNNTNNRKHKQQQHDPQQPSQQQQQQQQQQQEQQQQHQGQQEQQPINGFWRGAGGEVRLDEGWRGRGEAPGPLVRGASIGP